MKCSVASTDGSRVNSIEPSPAFKSWRKMCAALELFTSVYFCLSVENTSRSALMGVGWWSLAKSPSVHSQPSTRSHTQQVASISSLAAAGELLATCYEPARYLPNIPRPACLIQFILASRLGRRWRGINDPETQPT